MAVGERDRRLAGHGSLGYVDDPVGWIAAAEQQIEEVVFELRQARARVHALGLEPAIQALPEGRLETEHEIWQRELQRQQVASRITALASASSGRASGIGAMQARRPPPTLDGGTPPRGISP